MAVKLKEKQFDCIQFKETLQAAMWKKSKAVNLEEYVAWLKNETSKIVQMDREQEARAR